MKILILLSFIFISCSAQALTLYVAPDGRDRWSGSEQAPLATIQEAHDRLAANPPNSDATVILKAGIYSQPSRISWTYSDPIYTTTIIGQSRASTVIDGGGHGDDWIRIVTTRGENANIRIRDLTVQNYRHAVSVVGDATDPAGWIGNIRIWDVGFDYIGGSYSSASVGYGAVRFINTRNSRIFNSRIRYAENDTRPDLIHGVYLAHHSFSNLVENVQFYRISGDPVRTRDDSGNNTIQYNTFQYTGDVAIYSEWFDESDECPSYNNVFRYNEWSGEDLLLFRMYGYDEHCGPSGSPRLSTVGNVKVN